jgi:predicted small secreted protein
MRLRLFIALYLVAFVLAACRQPAPTVGEDRAFANACDRANDGQRIAVRG